MKETVFTFRVRLRADALPESVEPIRQRLMETAGVCSVTTDSIGVFCDFGVKVQFEDSAAAERLHRKLMRDLKAIDGVTITGVETTLTDIY